MTDLHNIRIKPLFEDSIIPTRAFPTDSGLDLSVYKFEKMYLPGIPDPISFDSLADSITLPAGGRVLINTGNAATVGPGFEIQIRPRSGLALKKGLTVLNTPGTIDESYRGMLGVIIINLSGMDQIISKKEKIAQMVVCPVILSPTVIVEDLDDTARNAGGFGHTGV